MQLSGHHVFITGGGSGIGLALAREFLRRGNKVTVCGRTREKLERAQAETPGLQIMTCDITDRSDLAKAVELLTQDQPVNVLVNNAAVGGGYSLLLDPEALQNLERDIGTNLTASVRATMLLLPTLVKQPTAAVINITSGLAVCPSPASPGYSVAKFGLHAFTRVLRTQLQNTSVRVFEVQPPMVDTALVSGSTVSKMSPETCAARIMKGLRRNRREIPIGSVRVMRVFRRLWPGLLAYVISRYPFSMEEVDARYEKD